MPGATPAATPAATCGQHTNEVLRELGYDEATVARWRAENVV